MDKDKDGALARRRVGDIAAFVEAAARASVQANMFEAAASLGGLDVQLVYFRGFNECRASKFVSGGQGLKELMSRIGVRGGSTQIARVLGHARNEARQAKVGALVFIGDAM